MASRASSCKGILKGPLSIPSTWPDLRSCCFTQFTRDYSLQALTEKESGNCTNFQGGFLLSSGSDEMLVVPAGVMAYYSSESDDKLTQNVS